MKKARISREVISLNRAAFRVSPDDLAGGELLDRFLAQVMGGLTDPLSPSSACTEFTCTLFAPPPGA